MQRSTLKETSKTPMVHICTIDLPFWVKHSFLQNCPFNGQTELVFGSHVFIERDVFNFFVPCFSSASTIWLTKYN